jgi:mannose-1-phosphate guanylyltransferase
MKAVVLVGGEGTRLRPLTETIPKPLIPMVDRPFLSHVLEHLARSGVDEVLLSSSYLGPKFAAFLEARRDAPAVTWVEEPTPLGTAGAIARATHHLDETFFVLNGDILTDLDLSSLLDAHRAAGAVGTITLTAVSDARPYGLVEADEAGRVLAFREKPADPVPGHVNAGTYVLEPVALAGVPPDRPVSIERDTFPALIGSGAPVQAFLSRAYWMDLGTPDAYLRATFDVLEGRVRGLDYAAPHVDPAADVSLRAHLGRWVVAAPGVSVAEEAEVEDSVLLAGASVGWGAKIRDSLLGPLSRVGPEAVVEGAVLAEGAVIPPGSSSRGARISAGRALEER